MPILAGRIGVARVVVGAFLLCLGFLVLSNCESATLLVTAIGLDAVQRLEQKKMPATGVRRAAEFIF